MTPVTVIVNPLAGKARHRKRIPALLQQLAGFCTIDQLYTTAQPGDARRISRGLPALAGTVLVVIGGDGTLHDAVNGLQESGNQAVSVGYIPIGTGNDFARAHDIPLQPAQAVTALRHTRTQQVNVGKAVSPELGTQYFVNNFGIGMDARIVYDTNHSEAKTGLNRLHLGQFAYLTNILKAISQQRGFAATWQGQQTHMNPRSYLFVFTNHPFLGGGIRLLPDARRDPHRLSLVVVNYAPIRTLLPILVNILQGRADHPRLHIRQRHHFRFATAAHEHIQIDGEEFSTPVHVTLTQVPQRFLLPVQA